MTRRVSRRRVRTALGEGLDALHVGRDRSDPIGGAGRVIFPGDYDTPPEESAMAFGQRVLGPTRRRRDVAVRAKFRCDGKVEQDGAVSLSFNAVYSPDPNSENRKFWDATPSGHLQMSVVNRAAAEQFEQGREYYLDFTPA